MRVFALAPFLSLLVATGCGSMLTSDEPPETVFWLEPLESPADAPNTGSPSIGVRVTAAPGLDTDRLLIRDAGATLNYYEGARWADYAPEVLESIIRSALEDTGRFRRVSSEVAGSADWSLELELRAFFAVLADDSAFPTIHLELRGYIDCQAAESPLRIAGQAPVGGGSLPRIVAGFQQVVDEGVATLVERLLRSCDSRQRSDIDNDVGLGSRTTDQHTAGVGNVKGVGHILNLPLD